MFRELLKNIVERMGDEAFGAILMDRDGISVEKVEKDGTIDIESAAMEYSYAFKNIFKAAEMLEAGKVNEIFIKNNKFSVIIRILKDDYFVALFIKPAGNSGKGRFLLRYASIELNREI